MRRFASADLWSGVLFSVFGLIFIGIARSYEFGSAASMGPGYFPTMLGGLLTLFGVVLIGRAIGETTELVEAFSLRTPAVIFGAILVFALLLERAGLILAGLALVGMGSFATEGFTPLRLLIYALGLVIGVAVLFVAVLGVQIPLFPAF